MERALDRVADTGADFAIALLHHPFDYLHEVERDTVERWFERGFDLVLRGHLHANKTRSIATQRGGFVEVAGPAAYQGSQWPNGCFLGEIHPRAHKIRLRPFTYASGPDPWVPDTKVFPDDAKTGHCREFVVPEKTRLPSSVSRVLRDAAELTVKSSSPALRSQIAQQFGGTTTGTTGGILRVPAASSETVKQASAAARTMAELTDFRTEILGGNASGIAVAQAIVTEAQTEEWRGKKVSYFTEPDPLSGALLLAGRLFLRVASKLGVRGRLREGDANTALAMALGLVTNTTVAQEPLLAGKLRPDIVLGLGPGQTKIDVIEVVRKGTWRVRRDHLRDLARYLETGIARQCALVLLDSLPSTETEPLVEHVTSEGADFLRVHL